MFKFNRLLDATTATWYHIVAARLATDEYDWSDNGGNAFIVDLIPLTDDDKPPITGLTLSVSNNGAYVMITKNLDKQRSTHMAYSEELQQDVVQEDMVDCIIDGSTLIVRRDICTPALDSLLKEPPESAGEVAGIIRAFREVMKLEGQTPGSIARMCEKVSAAAGIALPDNFVKES